MLKICVIIVAQSILAKAQYAMTYCRFMDTKLRPLESNHGF